MKIFEINEIELENIKTYVYEKIKFSQGNNVLIGENGAGKSTILESIYLSLFGDTVSGRNLVDMIRFGQQQGKIVIRFTVDNALYRIEDNIVTKGENRTTQTQVLVNQDLGDTIAEGRNAVRDKMEELLDIDATTFISAIYASQGEIGKIVTAKDKERKKLFDRLFQIERYEKAWTNLSKVEKMINNRISKLGSSIKILKDDLIDLPENQKQLILKKNQLKQIKKELIEKKTNYNEIDQKYKSLENLITKYNQLTAEKKHLEDQQKLISNSINSQFKIIKGKLKDDEFECTLKSMNHFKKRSMSKMESILKEIDKLRENEQSIKLNLERISNLEQTIQLLASTINQSKDEFDTEIEYFLSKISELTKNITLWDEKIPAILKNTEIKITKLKTKEKKFENKANKITILKIELKSKDDILNKSHNRIFQKRLLLAQEAGEDWRKMIEDLSEINFKTELEKTTLKISKLDEMQTELLKQKSALENSFRGIQSDLQHLSSLKGEETCPTCKQTLTKETFEELSTTLNSNMKNNQNKIKILNKKIQDLRKEIKEAKEQEKEMRKKNHLYSSLKPNFDELTILENEKDEMEKEVKTLREKLQKLNEEYNQEQLDNMKESISIEEERIKDIQAVKRLLPKLMKIKEKIITDNKQLDLLRKEFSQLKSKLTIKNLKTIEKNISAQEDEYKEFKQLIDELDQIIKDHQNEKTYRNQIKSIHNELLEVESVKDFNEHKKIEDKRIKLGNLISSKEATIRSLKDEVIPPLVEQIKKLENKEKQLKDKEIEIKHERKKVEISSILRGLMRELPNKLLPNFIERINRTATEILQSIMPGSDIQNIVLNDDYSLNIIRLGNYENINVLSGGETIIIALALRLAFAKEFSALDLLILDEPTIFLDERRREELVSVLEKNRLVKQMFVVTHDPDFERISDKTYFITKSAGETTVKTMEEEDEVIESSITNFTL